MDYTCPRCRYSTNHKGHFVRHIHNKRLCPNTFSDVSLDTLRFEFATEGLKTYHCEQCNKCFKTRSGLAYHRPICNEVIDIETPPNEKNIKTTSVLSSEKEAQLIELTEEVKKLKNIVTHMHTSSYNAQIINNGDIKAFDNSHHQHLHFHLNSFGNETKEHISREFAVECFKKGAYGILDMLDKIYFDNNAPENHNIKIRSLKNMLVEVFKDPHWEVRGFHDTVDGMISMSRNEIIKDIDCNQLLSNEELMFTLQNIMNPPSYRVKNIKEHTKARLVQRREHTPVNASLLESKPIYIEAPDKVLNTRHSTVTEINHQSNR
jgi:hypothetical protein